MTTYYKIRHKETGLYSKGGQDVNFDWGWSKVGKVWTSLGRLRQHLTLLTSANERGANYNTSQWTVVEFEVKEVGSKELLDVIDPKKLFERLKR